MRLNLLLNHDIFTDVCNIPEILSEDISLIINQVVRLLTKSLNLDFGEILTIMLNFFWVLTYINARNRIFLYNWWHESLLSEFMAAANFVLLWVLMVLHLGSFQIEVGVSSEEVEVFLLLFYISNITWCITFVQRLTLDDRTLIWSI